MTVVVDHLSNLIKTTESQEQFIVVKTVYELVSF